MICTVVTALVVLVAVAVYVYRKKLKAEATQVESDVTKLQAAVVPVIADAKPIVDAVEAAVEKKYSHRRLMPLVWGAELDPMAEAVLDQVVVHKFSSVVDIRRAQREGQADSDLLKRLNDKSAVAHHKRRTLSPPGSDVGHDQAADVATAIDLSAMGDEAHFHAARQRLVPIGKGAQRYTPARLRRRPPCEASSRVPRCVPDAAIGRSSPRSLPGPSSGSPNATAPR